MLVFLLLSTSILVPIVHPQTCTRIGFQCSDDCKHTGYCLPVTTGGFQWTQNGDCGSLYCDPIGQNCSLAGASTCENADIYETVECGGRAIYPYPYDCRRYCICGSTNPKTCKPEHCAPNYGFNPCTLNCDIPLTNNQCNNPATVCSKAWEPHVITSNPQLFYICKPDNNNDLIPVMSNCPEHEVFDVSSQQCIPQTEAPCTSDGGNNNNNNNNNNNTSCSVTCTNMGIRANPCNCTRYYFCRADLTPVPVSCDTGRYFDANSGGCIIGTCTNT